MHTTTPEIFDAAVARYESFKNDARVFDPRIATLVHTFNRLKGVATVWSCSGHPENEAWRGYIIFVVNDDGVQVLNAISDFIFEYGFNFIHKTQTRLHAMQLLSLALGGTMDDHHKCWKLESDIRTCKTEEIQKFWNELSNYLVEQCPLKDIGV